MTSRRGFTLVELLVALVLLATVLGATYQLLVNTQRVSRAQSEHVDMQSNMRSGALILASELRAVGFDTVPGAATVSPDILDNQPTSVRFRAIRSSGLICAYGSNYFVVDTVRDYAAYRQPTTNDRLMVFADRDTTLSSDDMWVRGRTITSFAAATCPNNTTWNSHAGLRFNVNTFPAPGATTPDSFTVGAPMRTFEDMTYALTAVGGQNYLTAQSNSAGGSAQPVLGPLAASGFALKYFDSTGTEITGNSLAERSRIRAIRVSVIGVTDQKTSSTGYGSNQRTTDSVVTLVALRNAIRH